MALVHTDGVIDYGLSSYVYSNNMDVEIGVAVNFADKKTFIGVIDTDESSAYGSYYDPGIDEYVSLFNEPIQLTSISCKEIPAY